MSPPCRHLPAISQPLRPSAGPQSTAKSVIHAALRASRAALSSVRYGAGARKPRLAPWRWVQGHSSIEFWLARLFVALQHHQNCVRPVSTCPLPRRLAGVKAPGQLVENPASASLRPDVDNAVDSLPFDNARPCRPGLSIGNGSPGRTGSRRCGIVLDDRPALASGYPLNASGPCLGRFFAKEDLRRVK